MKRVDFSEKQKEILRLATDLIKIPGISVGRFLNIDGLFERFEFILNYLRDSRLRVIEFNDRDSIPGLYCDMGNAEEYLSARMLLLGHYDCVSPVTETQMSPVIENDWLRARGATDMLCTVATFMVLLKDLKYEMGKLNCGLLLVGNEEPGETERWGTPHILEELKKSTNYYPEFVIVGERTGEGAMKSGKLEYKNRGLIRVKIESSGKVEHSAQIKGLTAIEKVMEFRNEVKDYFSKHQDEEWKTTFAFPYFIAGEFQNFNTTPGTGLAGMEIRPIPEQDFTEVIEYIEKAANDFGLKIDYVNREPGIITSLENPYIQMLLRLLVRHFGGNPYDYLGSGKIHATQARFIKSPVVIFGQSGIGPHSDNEAHYIPSIIPYYLVLREFLTYASSKIKTDKQA